MQALRTRAQASVELSKTLRGKPRAKPVWVMRYRLVSGKDSRKVLGPAWTKRSRPAVGYLTRGEAAAAMQAFLAAHATDGSSARRTFGVALEAFLRYGEEEKALRGSTVHGYRQIAERLAAREWRGGLTWRDRILDTFDVGDLLGVRAELTGAGRSAETVNHYRRVLRGIFGTQPTSPALAWAWMGQRAESEGKLRFYTPEQVGRLLAAAHSAKDRAIYTLMSEAGPRLSETRALKVSNVDFAAEVVRFEDGYTSTGGHAGNKGRRVRSVPMSEHVRDALWSFCRGKDRDALVFEHDVKSGEPICGTSLYRRFRSASARAGLPAIRLHDLRHTFGTQAIQVLKVHEVQQLMGHRHITTTERYLHYAPDPDTGAKLSALWAARDAGPPSGAGAGNVVALRPAA